jgi:SAM-dependent methyltransferase
MSRRGLQNLLMLALRGCGPLVKLFSPFALPLTVLDAKAWDREYGAQKWQFLHNVAERAHHLAIASYVDGLKPNGRVLDVGCGEGILNLALRKFRYGRYLGTDISATAIASAQRLADERTAFQAIAGDNFTSPERFDAIVFNETLYLFADPIATIAHYSRFLAEDGIFIISMSMVGLRQGWLTLDLWRQLEKRLAVVDETTIYRPAGATWVVRVLATPSSAERLRAAVKTVAEPDPSATPA